uniref:Uncharacterized protein n=1 Tax=Rhizophora mucronata TaxID=61149 RepID=A0A2P2PGI6_RHIMU
MHISKTTT